MNSSINHFTAADKPPFDSALFICPDDGAGVNFEASAKSIRNLLVLQTDGAHRFLRFIGHVSQ